jgi:hypothetical protein
MAQPGQAKPTQIAEELFNVAAAQANRAYLTKTMPQDLAYVLEKTVEGLSSMAVGIRAAYLLLEQVKEMLRRQNASLSGRP